MWANVFAQALDYISKINLNGSSWWFKNALFVWFLLSLVWGVLTITLDVIVLWLHGSKATISWQCQQVSLDNRVIPGALGFLVWGLAVHFWYIHSWDWHDPRHPLWNWLIGGLMGALFVALTWTQRGD